MKRSTNAQCNQGWLILAAIVTAACSAGRESSSSEEKPRSTQNALVVAPSAPPPAPVLGDHQAPVVSLPQGVSLNSVAIAANGTLTLGQRVDLATSAGSPAMAVNSGTGESVYGVDAKSGRLWSVGRVTLRGRVSADANVKGFVRSTRSVQLENGARVEGPIERDQAWRTDNIPYDFEAAGTVDINPNSGAMLTPGVYGRVRIQPNFKVTFVAGTYSFRSLAVEANAVVRLENRAAPVMIHVGEAFTYRGRFEEAAEPEYRGNVQVVASGAGVISLDSPFLGTLVAPRADVQVRACGGNAHRGAIFGRNVTLEDDAHIEHHPFRSQLIKEVKLSLPEVCVNQPLDVQVSVRSPGGDAPRVMIDGVSGLKQKLQFSSFGPRRITISALTNLRSEVRSVPLMVVPCDQKYPNLVTRRSLYEPNSVEFMLLNPSEFSAPGTTYRWDFGDESVQTTATPFARHSYLASLDATLLESTFQTSLTIQRPGLAKLVVKKVVVYANDYARSRASGYAHPPVTQAGRYLRYGGKEAAAEFMVHNLEAVPIHFTRRVLERHYCDPDRDPTVSAPEPFDLTVPAEGSAATQVVLRDPELGPEACGVSVHLLADGPDNVALSASAHFDIPRRRPLPAQPVNDAAMVAYLRDLIARGLVTDPNTITQQQIEQLVREGRAPTPPVPTTTPRFVRGATGDEGDVCILGDSPPRPGLACKPEPNEWELSPAFIRNARKGDMFINAGCGPIAKLLQSIGQTYSHEAIMTQNYYGLAHSTASKDYLTADIPKDERAVGYNRFTEHRLRYAWPGALKESVDEAFNGARYLADDGKVYSMNTFNPEPQQCEGFSTSYPILVIRPPLESDSLVRPILHQAADIAKAAESHYRFFAFTQGNVSFDPPQNYSSRPVVPGYTNQYPLNTSFRSPSGEPATVSTTFLWDALKRAGATLEGCQFEDSDGSTNDRRDTFWVGLPYASDTDCTSPRIGGTVDGLYWYREALRDVAGQAVYDATYNDVAAEIAKGGGNAVFVAGVAGHFIGDHASSFAHQMLNCFAYDACSENLVGDDSTRYDPTVEGSRSPLPFGDGVSVSPDDFLMWDTPAQGGVYGQSEKAQLRSGEYRRIHRWRAAEGTFTVVGQVLRAGAPVAGATVEVGPAVTVSDVNGNFRVAGVEGGNVSVRAQKTIDGESYTDEELVQVSASTPLVVLELTAESSRPPEGLVLYARRVNITGNTRIKDDEGFGETDQFKDTPINAFCEVSPLMRRTALTLRSECAGGETWGESTVECLLLPNNQDVQVVLNVKLYEGTSCGTTDLDGTAPPALIPSLAPGQNAPIGTRANNDDPLESGGDYASTALVVENVQGSALDLPIIDANLRRRVKIEAIDIDVVDHETVGTNEIVRDRTLVKYCYVDPLYPKDNESDATECAGDEVQGRLEWACSLIPGSGGAVRLGITLSMYEGVTCSTKGSPDKTASAELIVQPCPPSGCGSGFDGPVSLVASDGANEVRVLVRASNELAP